MPVGLPASILFSCAGLGVLVRTLCGIWFQLVASPTSKGAVISPQNHGGFGLGSADRVSEEARESAPFSEPSSAVPLPVSCRQEVMFQRTPAPERGSVHALPKKSATV